jgi:hypothetical protein
VVGEKIMLFGSFKFHAAQALELEDGESNKHAANDPSHGRGVPESQAGERFEKQEQRGHLGRAVGAATGHDQDIGRPME